MSDDYEWQVLPDKLSAICVYNYKDDFCSLTEPIGLPIHLGKPRTSTLMLVYHCHKPGFTPKIAIFRRAGMREGGLPLPLAFQYLILMI